MLGKVHKVFECKPEGQKYTISRERREMSSEENLMEGIEISQESQEQGQNNHDKE